MKSLLDFNKAEINSFVLSLNEKKFRAEQLYNLLYSGKSENDILNIPKSLVEKIVNLDYTFQPIKIFKVLKSKGTIKFLYKLLDDNIIEGVLMQYKFGNTICVSTQVGCKMNCLFCASGLNGFVRSLSAGEIIGQIIAVNSYLGGNLKDRKITNIVLMGSGEPLDNFDNVVKFLQMITDDSGLNYSVRNISLSTCGIPNKIEELADKNMPITLCLSLHAPNDEIRKEIMPIAKRYNIKSIIEAIKYYNTITNRRIIIEYTLIDGINNSSTHARELAELLQGLPCHINLIKLNEVSGRNLKSPTDESCKQFLGMLNRLGISATMRRTLGDDIEGACGQLRNKELSKSKK